MYEKTAFDVRELGASALKARRLTLLRELLASGPLSALLAYAEALSRGEEDAAAEAGARVLHELAAVDELWSAPELSFAANPLEAWLIRAVITTETPFARAAERGVEPGPLLSTLFKQDLAALDALRRLAPAVLPPEFAGPWQSEPLSEPAPLAGELEAVVRRLAGPQPWAAHVLELQRFYRAAGAGPFNQAAAFTWDPAAGFTPVRRLDPIRLEHFIGYERERAQVVENTERLVRGLPAHNVLLYGDRGTGKSATVKALAHAFKDRRLKIIEVGKAQLPALPKLLSRLWARGLYFILFVDDLSFEGAETEYKELKAFLEGSIQAPPAHVKVYATSNRRHIVKESFADREGPYGDVRARDNMEEKLSLADRFGLTVIFTAPEEKAYLEIVRGLAARRGLRIDPEVLERQALQWAQWQNGRSARAARQFVEGL